MTDEQAAWTAPTVDADPAPVSSRDGLVEAAVRNWVRDLIDLGPRNQLLYYRDLSVGTLDLATADPGYVENLIAGTRTWLSDLFPGDALEPVRKRARAVHAKVLEMQEERGIYVGYLAEGMATWDDSRDRKATRPPAAPVLLRRITIEPRSAAGDDYTLEVDEEVEVNPVLIHLLETQFTAAADSGTLETLAAGIADTLAFDRSGVYDHLTTACAEVPGFTINERTVIGTFSYAKLPMVNDLKRGRELLVAHDIVAALAGDRDAQTAIRDQGGAEVDPAAPDYAPPTDEFLVMDADSSQSYAINAVVAGNNLVIKGPPGTGKSQTISNLIASLISRGQKVLFVAEKRAAIDAVLSRLGDVDLSQWVMDLHDGAGNRRRTAQSLASSLQRAAATPRPALDALHRDLVGTRSRPLAHEQAMHEPRDPLGPHHVRDPNPTPRPGHHLRRPKGPSGQVPARRPVPQRSDGGQHRDRPRCGRRVRRPRRPVPGRHHEPVVAGANHDARAVADRVRSGHPPARHHALVLRRAAQVDRRRGRAPIGAHPVRLGGTARTARQDRHRPHHHVSRRVRQGHGRAPAGDGRGDRFASVPQAGRLDPVVASASPATQAGRVAVRQRGTPGGSAPTAAGHGRGPGRVDPRPPRGQRTQCRRCRWRRSGRCRTDSSSQPRRCPAGTPPAEE